MAVPKGNCGHHGGMTPVPSHETLRVVYVDTAGAVVHISEHSDGLPDRVTGPVRQILTQALASGAAALVLSHNHPGGDPRPSRADIATTGHLARVSAALGIRVHDHIVTGDGRNFSFRATGLL